MSKTKYLEQKNWSGKKRIVFNKIVEIVDEFQTQGYRMTLRQLYYQLVSRDIIANSKAEYAKLSTLLTEARMYGLIDWDFIEDRIRIPKMHGEWSSIESLMDSAVSSYRKRRWIDQDNYLEVWVEKDALSGVLEPITEKYHVSLMVNRGYSSSSAMHDASLRFRRQEAKGKTCYILYLGDHDPSGMDMVRDIRDRLNIFGCNVEVKRIALNMEQIEQFNPPPNPAKITDPRSTGYIEEFGNTSWELDALSPKDLNDLLDIEIGELIDKEKYNEILKIEDWEKTKIQEAGNQIDNEEYEQDDLSESDEAI